jgi:transglutaminase-like putative cysteine protease
MRRSGAWCLAVLLCVLPSLRAADPQGKVVSEAWDAAYLEGTKVGFSHTTVRELDRDGEKFVRTTMELDLTIARYKTTARLRMELGDDETSDGKVQAYVMRLFTDNNQQVLLTSVVEGNRLHIKSADGRQDTTIPWNDQVVGLNAQERIFQDHKVKPGDRFTFLNYDPTVTSVITMHVTVKDDEEVEILGKKKKLLRADVVPDKLRGPQGPIPLPSMTYWLDDDLRHVRTETELPAVGTIVLYRTTKQVAVAPAAGPPSRATDIGLNSLVRLNRPIPRPADSQSVLYRITIKGDEEPASAFAHDERQSIANVQGSSVDLQVHAVRAPRPVENPGTAKDEFLKSCYFITSDDARVRDEAREAVGRETDPWRKAQRIERWVYQNVEHDDSVAFCAADKVAENLKGDCRHKALLSAAMCRAAGVPSRTAVGLVYTFDRQRGPVMAFHMWTEVWVDGQWVAIDGTLGRGSVGADHIKIADSSWSEVRSLEPLLPVARVLGKLNIEVVRVNGED